MHQGIGSEADEGGNSDQQMRRAELIISYVLRGGVLLSAGVILLGVILFYIRYAANSHSVYTQTYPHSLGGVVQGCIGVWHRRRRRILEWTLLLVPIWLVWAFLRIVEYSS